MHKVRTKPVPPCGLSYRPQGSTWQRGARVQGIHKPDGQKVMAKNPEQSRFRGRAEFLRVLPADCALREAAARDLMH